MDRIQSPRLFYREITDADFDALKAMLSDPLVMYAWEHTFTDGQIRRWIQDQQAAYQSAGVGYFAAAAKEGGQLVGQIGLHRFSLRGGEAYEVCYMLRRGCFHQGYALEGVTAMVNYAFTRQNLPEVYAQIKTTNAASVRVAERAGFVRGPIFPKHYNGKDMPHYLYVKQRP